jgi:hypothetical protein
VDTAQEVRATHMAATMNNTNFIMLYVGYC